MSEDRRGFLRTIVRGALGALLAGGTGWLAFRSGEPCWTEGCRRCPELDGCELPEGRLTRAQRRTRPASEYPPTGEEPEDDSRG